MGILDKLRPQSKSTHPDPNIRIEAVHETDTGDLAALGGFAKDDADARVRRAAVARITDAAVLAEVANLKGMSGHADAGEMVRWLSGLKSPRKVFLTHGEEEAAYALAARIKGERGFETRVPAHGEAVEL